MRVLNVAIIKKNVDELRHDMTDTVEVRYDGKWKALRCWPLLQSSPSWLLASWLGS